MKILMAVFYLAGFLFSQNENLQVSLEASSEKDTLETEVVKAREKAQKEKKVAKQVVEREEFRMVVGNLGDPMRSMVTLPGVNQSSDLSVRPWIRGGDERETRVFWNGIPLIQPYHMTSFFSIFPIETIETMETYTSGFPASGQGSLSGAVHMTSRRPDLDTLVGNLDLSLLRGGLYTSVPIVEKEFGIYGFYQQLLYSIVYDGVLSLTELLASKATAEEIEESRDLFELPNFRDVGGGAFYKPNNRLTIGYDLLWASDYFYVINREEVDNYRDLTTANDTVSWVDVSNSVHSAEVKYVLNDAWTLKTNGAWQRNFWDVDFNDDELQMQTIEQSYHLKSAFLYDGWKGHGVELGWSLDYVTQDYQMNMARPIYQLVTQSSLDFSSTLSLFDPAGYEVGAEEHRQEVEAYAKHVMHQEKGWRDQILNGIYAMDEMTLGSGDVIRYGVRIEHESQGNSFFFSPRGDWVTKLAPKHLLSLSLGWYSQNQFPFEYRHYNPDLSSEKAVHLNGEWTWKFAKNWYLEVGNYYKFYHDLVYPTLVKDGVNWATLADWFVDDYYAEYGTWPEEFEFQEANANYYDFYDADFLKKNWHLLDAEKQNFFENQHQAYRLNYENGGIGHAVGTEWTLHYHPTNIWRGRFGVETSLSMRRDGNSDIWYAYQNHRYWVLRWMNHLQFEGGYSLGIRQLFSSGKPYTPWETFEEGPVNFRVGERNSRRYNTYVRADLSLSHKGTLFGYPFETYTEVWNIFYNPNAFLRDSETEELEGVDLSLPLPVLFTGMRLQF